MDATKRLALKTYRHFMHDSLYRNSIFLMGNTIALGIFSFIFWLFAARIYSTNDVGIVSAVVAASTLLATLSFFGFDYALIKFIPRSNKAALRTNTGLTFAALLSIIASFLYLVIITLLIPKFSFLTSSWVWIASFTLLIIATTWNTLTNSIFIAHRIAQYALLGTILLGITRLPLVYFLKPDGEKGLLISQLAAMVICVIVCFIFLRNKIGYKYKIQISKSELKHMSSYAFSTYLSNVSGGLPALILPTIILKMLGAPAAAYFFIANQFAYLLYTIPSATSQSLFAEGAWQNGKIEDLIKKSAKLMCAFVFSGTALMIAFGWILLSLFGKNYAASGYWMLFLFSLTALPKIASYLFSTVLRIYGHVKEVVVIATIGTIIQLGASYIGMRITSNLVTLGIAALLCEIFVSSSYVFLFYRYRKQGAFSPSA